MRLEIFISLQDALIHYKIWNEMWNQQKKNLSTANRWKDKMKTTNKKREGKIAKEKKISCCCAWCIYRIGFVCALVHSIPFNSVPWMHVYVCIASDALQQAHIATRYTRSEFHSTTTNWTKLKKFYSVNKNIRASLFTWRKPHSFYCVHICAHSSHSIAL